MDALIRLIKQVQEIQIILDRMKTKEYASGGTFNGLPVQDEGTPIGSAQTLNFIGDAVTAVMNGDTADITITGGSGINQILLVRPNGGTVTGYAVTVAGWQAAIDAAVDNDVILVPPCTLTGDLTVANKSIAMLSWSSAGPVTLQHSLAQSVILVGKISLTNSTGHVLKFGIEGMAIDYYGLPALSGAIECSVSWWVETANCTVENAGMGGTGFAIFATGAGTPSVTTHSFNTYFSASGPGGAIYPFARTNGSGGYILEYNQWLCGCKSDVSLAGNNAFFDYDQWGAVSHDAVTVADTSTINLTLTGQQISGVVIPSGIKLDSLGDADDTTLLDSTLIRHGLLPKLDGNTDNYLRGDGAWATPPTGVLAPHHETHEFMGDDAIKLDDLYTPDDNTDLDSSSSRHGLLPKLPNDTTLYLRGDGTWVNPNVALAPGHIIQDEGVDVPWQRNHLNFIGDSVTASDNVLDDSTDITIVDETAKVSSDDTTTGYLSDKIAAGDNITITVLNPGGNEQLEINSTGGGGGAPIDAKYVVSEANDDLTQEIVIPSMGAHADRAGYQGATISNEFDSVSDGLLWNASTPGVCDSNTSVTSHLYMRQVTANGTEYWGAQAWTPEDWWEAWTHVLVGTPRNSLTGHTVRTGLIVASSDDTVRARVQLEHTASATNWTLGIYTYDTGTWSSRSTVFGMGGLTDLYLRLTYTSIGGQGALTAYWSTNGILWQAYYTILAYSISVGKVGVMLQNSTTSLAATIEAAYDFIRAQDMAAS